MNMDKSPVKELEKFISSLEIKTNLGGLPYKLVARDGEYLYHIQFNVYRDEFPPYQEGRKQMEEFIATCYRWMEKEHPNISICANVIFKKKSNMRDTTKYL